MGNVRAERIKRPLPEQSGRGKSGLRRTGWPLTAASSDRGKVPQKKDRPFVAR